jgi:putative tRNA adenosine deaminase-associated protein
VDESAVDFAIAAWREDGLWQVVQLPPRTGDSLETLVNALRGQPGEGGVFGLVSVAEEFFVLARVIGEDTRLLVSDVYAAEEWPLGIDALDKLGIPPSDDEDADAVAPGGDLRIVDDFGVGTVELELLIDDEELWPDEVLANIAGRLGFGEQFDALLEQLPD